MNNAGMALKARVSTMKNNNTALIEYGCFINPLKKSMIPPHMIHNGFIEFF
jgi:hypothetical protein